MGKGKVYKSRYEKHEIVKLIIWGAAISSGRDAFEMRIG
jgi:hypothetical protein